MHHDREHPHDQLHHAVVVEDREQRRDEDDRRQHLEGEDDAVARAFRAERAVHRAAPDAAVAQRAEHERGADAGKAEQLVDAGAKRLEDPLPDRRLEHDQREHDLQPRPQRDGRPVDRAAVVRERDRDRQDDERAEQRLHDAEHQRTSPTIRRPGGGRSSPMVIARGRPAASPPRAVRDRGSAARAPDRRRAPASPGLARTMMPTAGSTGSSTRSRPAPSATEARPTSSASRRGHEAGAARRRRRGGRRRAAGGRSRRRRADRRPGSR